MSATPDRWRSLEELFQAALNLPPGQRGAYLNEHCPDEQLRQEVEALLGFAPQGDPILKDSPWGQSVSMPPGTELGPYRVSERIGSGGMGEVYKAHDTRLGREVALKVLPEVLMSDPGRRARFVSEARTASRLNHPNCVTVYDIGEQDGRVFIAMEYVEGKTLDAVIPRAGLPLGETLKYAIPIAAALTKAHAAGIIHRDLKPGNIMVTADGTIKLLDFGLAKLQVRVPTENTATMQPQTQTGMIIGTPAFMSPEQAEGKPVDTRSDIFSFGALLYEMAAGKRAFRGDSMMATMAAVLHKEPDPLPENVALDLQKVILRCLRKDPERRFQNMGDVRVSLEELREESLSGSRITVSGIAVSGRRATLRRAVWIAGVAAVAVALALVGMRVFRYSPDAAVLRTVKFVITPTQLVRGGDGEIDAEVSVSRDGKHIAWVESPGSQLWVRDIDEEKAHVVPGATGVYQVFWSPDNRYFGYASGRGCGGRPGCDLVRIPVEGGTPIVITKLQGPFRRACWSSDGETILYGEAPNGLFTIPTRGGTPTRVIQHPHIEHPSFVDLPDGRHAYLYQAADGEQPGHAIYIQVAGEARRHLVTLSTSNNPYPAYSPTGHIIYVNGDIDAPAIWALPFSLATMQPTGKAFPIVQRGSSPMVSKTGTLVYSDVPSNQWQLTWVDRSGKVLSTIGEPEPLDSPVLSPDNRQLAVNIRGSGAGLWVYDLARGVKTRVTVNSTSPRQTTGAWTPSGTEITYSAFGGGYPNIYSKPVDGNGEAVLLVGKPLPKIDPDWSPDQRFLIYCAATPETKGDLLYRERRQDGSLGEAAAFLKTPYNERVPRFSPDGNFVAYMSDESGEGEIYVRDFPQGARKWQISNRTGSSPRWRRDGKEIFYVAQGKLMAVSIALRPVFTPGTPAPLFAVSNAQFDVAADGKRFVVMERPTGEPPLSLHVVHNWFEDFRGQQGGAGQ